MKKLSSSLAIFGAIGTIWMFWQIGKAPQMGGFYWAGIICGGVLALCGIADWLDEV